MADLVSLPEILITRLLGKPSSCRAHDSRAEHGARIGRSLECCAALR